MSYTKLFNSILTSSVWGECHTTRIVWITMLALANQNGEVEATIPGLARLASVTIEECETAIACFLAPDPYSRTKADNGRRIEKIDGGWYLLNYAEHRRRASKADATEKNAERQKRFRDRHERNATVTHSNATVTHSNATVTHSNATVTVERDIAEAEAEAEKMEESVATAPPTSARGCRLPKDFAVTPEMREWATCELPGLSVDRETANFRDYWAAASGRTATKRDWVAAWRVWMRKAAEYGKTVAEPVTTNGSAQVRTCPRCEATNGMIEIESGRYGRCDHK